MREVPGVVAKRYATMNSRGCSVKDKQTVSSTRSRQSEAIEDRAWGAARGGHQNESARYNSNAPYSNSAHSTRPPRVAARANVLRKGTYTGSGL